jgi:hypothetical protein
MLVFSVSGAFRGSRRSTLFVSAGGSVCASNTIGTTPRRQTAVATAFSLRLIARSTGRQGQDIRHDKVDLRSPCPITPKASFGKHRVFVDRVVRELFDEFPRNRREIRFREFRDDQSVLDDMFCLECSCTQFYAYNMHRRKLLEVSVNHLARLHA